MSLSKKEVEDLKPILDRAVLKVMGFTEPTLVTAAINCIDKGYDEKKTAGKLKAIVDEVKAGKLAEKLFYAYDDYRASPKGRKRKEAPKTDEILELALKKKKLEQLPPEPGQPSPGQLTTDKIKEMMMNAQKMIHERKAQLGTIAPLMALPIPDEPMPPPTVPLPPEDDRPPPCLSEQQAIMNDAMDTARKAAALQARIQAQFQRAMGGIPGSMGQKNEQQTKPTPLILDDQGRTIDAKTGEAIQLTQHKPELKANIRAQKREQFKAVIQERAPEEIADSKYFDPRVSLKGATRSRRMFKFHEEGKFQQLASRLRTKAQLEKLQGEIASAAKKTGIASAAKLATLEPKNTFASGVVPNVEWWDSAILPANTYDGLNATKLEGITHLIEHPAQMKPPAEPSQKVEIAVMLTKKERKKMRRQNRKETQRELTEKIRLGLMPPPEPKVRLANLMRVLGTEAVQDPTKVEAHVRAQMEKRVRTHEETNAARKLTKEQRSEKKIGKIKEDTSLGVHVSVYRINDLSDQAKKFKVEKNAAQLYMTGAVVLHKDCNVVVVEGGPKQQKKFRRLMMHRIKWSEEKRSKAKEREDSDDEASVNTCHLVWEGMVKNRSFGEIRFKMCPTQSFAREQFNKHNVPHYWDLAYRGSVLESAGDDTL